jgi:hypothetical protein
MKDCKCNDCPVAQLKILLGTIVSDISKSKQLKFRIEWPYDQEEDFKQFVAFYLHIHGFRGITIYKSYCGRGDKDYYNIDIDRRCYQRII